MWLGGKIQRRPSVNRSARLGQSYTAGRSDQMKRIVVGLVVGGATLAAAIPASASPPTWHSTTLAAPAFPGFVGVGASSASDVWAVGENDADRETPYAQHWNGSSWSSVPIPLPGPSSDILDGGLFGVSALSASKAWAVGWH